MALSTHPGGAADKAGLFHEALWGVDAFLAVLKGEASAIRTSLAGDEPTIGKLVFTAYAQLQTTN